MAKLSQSQLEMYARSAGLSADRARVAAAVAMAESGGETTAHNPVPPDDSYGLWQINMLGAMGPARRKALGITSNEQLYDPAVNARAMAMISAKGSNFRPWSTYTNGAYEKFLGAAEPGAGGAEPTLNLDDLNDFGKGLLPFGTGLDGVAALAELGVGAAEWMGNPHNWVRTVQVAVGGVLVAVGLATITRGTWQPVADAAGKVATITPAGRITATTRTRTAARAVRSGGRGVKSAPKASSA